MGEQTSTAVKEAAAVKPKLPILTELERVVYARCVDTGDDPRMAMENDDKLHAYVLEEAASKLRMDKILLKLENNKDWLKKQIDRFRAGT